MRVLMTTDTVGGVWNYSLELARALLLCGHQVTLATMGAPLRAEQRAETQLRGLELHTSDFKLEWMDDPWEDVRRAGDWLLRIEANAKPDVVHLNTMSHGSLPWKAPTLVVGHSCVLSWWKSVKGEDAPGEWNRYRREIANGLRSADVVASPTWAMLGLLEERYGPLGRSTAIPNGRDSDRFRPGNKEDLVLAAGRLWDEAKNIAVLAEAAASLDWPVVVAGEDSHPQGGRVRFGNVRLLGMVAPQILPLWYARAGIYALPAKYEPFGLTVLEAALSRCALALGDIPSLREVWGDAALFVPPDDVEALKDALSRLISDTRLRGHMADRARARALDYTPGRMAEGYLAVYHDLLGDQGETPVAVSEEWQCA